MQARLQLLLRKHLARGRAERVGKTREVFFSHCQTGGHFVTAEFFQP